MKRSGEIFSELKLNRLIALLNPSSIEECVTAYETCKSYGVILEIAFRSEYAVEGIKAVIKKYPDALLLAGTVMTRRQAEDAISAGASGVVSTDYIPEVVAACVNKDIMCIPGGLSDAGKQLAQKAKEYGCSLEELRKKYPYQWVYKLFPAFTGNISNVELSCSWKGPFKDLTVIYTGGINLSTLKQADRSGRNFLCFCLGQTRKGAFQDESRNRTVERSLKAKRTQAGCGSNKKTF